MKKLLISISVVLTLFCVLPVFAQNKSSISENQCEMYGKEGFVGKKMSYNFNNTEIRDVLIYFYEQYGCNFVIDKAISKIYVTVTLDNVPWNRVLNAILKAQGLGIEKNDKLLRVAELETLKNEYGYVCERTETQLYTELVRLKNLKLVKQDSRIFSDVESGDENTSKFIRLISKLLSKDGAIEMDFRQNVLIFTDVRNRIELVSDFVKLLDNSGFTLEDLISKTVNKHEPIITQTIKTQNIFPVVICYGPAGPSNGIYDPPLWANHQGSIFLEVALDLSIKGLKMNRRELIVTDTPKRVELIKSIVALFDQPYLVEEFENNK